MEKKVEISIISGFLGSGKTTLLKHLLAQERRGNRKYAVLMNEIGQVAIDRYLLDEQTPIEEIIDGCICCTSKAQLENALLTLFTQKNLDVIYIEGSGIAHPMEVYDACLSPVIAQHIKIKSIMTIVDSYTWLKKEKISLRMQKLLTEQVKYADQILINKVDLLTSEQLQQVIKEVNGFNRHAKQHLTTFSQLALSAIEDREKRNLPTTTHEKQHVAEHLHVSSFTYTFTKPICRTLFMSWLKQIPTEVYRMKGFLRFSDCPKQLSIFQYAYGMPFFYSESVNLPLNLVIIGEKINQSLFEKQLLSIETEGKLI